MKSWTSFRRLYLIIVAVSGFLLAPVVLTSYFWNVWPQTSEELVRYTIQIPSSFELTDQNGRIVKQSTLIGKPTVVFFGFSNCPDVCPTTLSNLTELMDRLGPDADRLNVLFISVDPERDTQERLASYLTSFDERIIGLTGSSKVIAEMTK
ncbi:MAG: SCO family protein, partial [Alphaproteobacteria bacterium]|nr:SCO family protein [Alphaproteobacteria bacterium]